MSVNLPNDQKQWLQEASSLAMKKGGFNLDEFVCCFQAFIKSYCRRSTFLPENEIENSRLKNNLADFRFSSQYILPGFGPRTFNLYTPEE